MLWVAFCFSFVATLNDLARREIPDWISVLLGLFALAALAVGAHPHGWTSALLAAALTFGLGSFLFHRGAFGGGDVKLLTAVALALGLSTTLVLLLATALFGGLWSLLAAARGERELAYAPPITLALGLLVLDDLLPRTSLLGPLSAAVP